MSRQEEAKASLVGGQVDGGGIIEPEDAPFRAVRMQSADLAPSLLSTGPKFDKPAFGIPRPTLRLSKSAPAAQSASFGVAKEWTGDITVPSTWEVDEKDLEQIPWQFPLERTHREIREDAAVVAKRISAKLRALSVQTEYDAAKAKCKTTDCVCFRIRLFAGSEDGGQPVVVEVQRRSGSAGSFMRTCRAILDSAQGQEETPGTNKRDSPPFTKPVGSLACLARVIAQEQQQSNCESEAVAALDCAMDMIRSDKRDSVILGLENLCCMVDPMQTNPQVATHVAKLVVCGQNDGNDVREELRLLMDRDVFSSDDRNNHHREQNDMHADNLRYLALCALSKSMESCMSLTSVLQQQLWFTESLVPCLVDELKRSAASPNTAYKAASCLHSMLRCQFRLVEEEEIQILKAAHQVGIVCHELLQQETEQCLKLVVDC